MLIEDIHEFVTELEKKGELRRVKTEVDSNLEIAEILRREMYSNGPAVFFENVKNKEQGVGKLSVPTMDGLLFIDFDEIIRCRAEGNYTEIFLKNKQMIVVSRTLGDIEEMLEGNKFFRVHQTHLINLKYLKKYIKGDGGQIVMIDGSTVDVARRKKEEFLAFIGKK